MSNRLAAVRRKPFRLASLGFGFRLTAELPCGNKAQTCGLLCGVRMRLRRMPYDDSSRAPPCTHKGYRPLTCIDNNRAYPDFQSAKVENPKIRGFGYCFGDLLTAIWRKPDGLIYGVWVRLAAKIVLRQ